MSNLQWVSSPAIHLVGAGPFRTYANHTWFVRSGWVVSGDGMYATTVQMTGSLSGMREVVVIKSDPNLATNNVTFTNLTIDCNWPQLSATADIGAGGEKNIRAEAIVLWGSNNLLDHVRCINSYGSLANKLEHFAMSLVGPRSADGTNNIIQFCRAEQPQGNYGNPFALVGWVNTTPHHLITNSKVVSCTAVGVNSGLWTGFTSGGVSFGNVKDCQIDGNTFIDCFGAAYTDTGTIDGLQITNNTVTRGWEGVGLVGYDQPKQNITITGNNFSIQNRNSTGASTGIAIAYGVTTNLIISNNTITFDTSGGGELSFWGLMTSLLSNATVSNNTIQVPNYPNANAAAGINVTLFNNLQPNGLPVPGL
jgi:hypothetical protein